MKIVVMGGSPKGDTSVTLQYVHYMQQRFPDHHFEVVQISSRINLLEKNEDAFREVIEEVRSADGVLWAFPLYFMLVPAQYKRFIELVFERGAVDAFQGRYAGVLTTSIHFYDHIAHHYMREICDDLGMRFVDFLSAEMYDLLTDEGRSQTETFARNFFDAIERMAPTARSCPPLVRSTFRYEPGGGAQPVDTDGRRAVIVHDARDPESNLASMVEQLSNGFGGRAEVINLHDVEISGACQGCLRCGQDNHCAYTGKDGFIDFYNDRLVTADIIVFGGSIVDRYLSSRWKTFFDRSFFNTHTPTLRNKQFGFLVAGPLGQLPMLRQMLEAWGEFQHSNVLRFISDEVGDSDSLDELISGLALDLVRFAEDGYVKPMSFLGVGGKKIFRDEVYGRLNSVFQADHRFFKANGWYDFPNRKLRRRVSNFFLGQLFRVPRIRREYDKRVKAGMIQPLRKVLERQV
jgi:multimeric flavodoxin WrbA